MHPELADRPAEVPRPTGSVQPKQEVEVHARSQGGVESSGLREYLSPDEQRTDEDVAAARVHPLPGILARSVRADDGAGAIDHVKVAVSECEVAVLIEGGHSCRQ